MIVLDTNIISELMKQSPSTRVMQWVDKTDSIQLFVTSITLAEITYGISALSEGSRLETAFTKTITEAFKHRVLSFDQLAAQHYGRLMSRRRALGRPLSILDGQIAAIAAAHGADIATRNIRDFGDCELELINPFD